MFETSYGSIDLTVYFGSVSRKKNPLKTKRTLIWKEIAMLDYCEAFITRNYKTSK